jgi:hypothetical protein
LDEKSNKRLEDGNGIINKRLDEYLGKSINRFINKPDKSMAKRDK